MASPTTQPCELDDGIKRVEKRLERQNLGRTHPTGEGLVVLVDKEHKLAARARSSNIVNKERELLAQLDALAQWHSQALGLASQRNRGRVLHLLHRCP